MASAAVLYGVTLASPWLRIELPSPSYEGNYGDVRPPTAQELLYGNDTIRAIGTTEMIFCLILLVAAAAWVLRPALARRPVRWPIARRACTVVLVVFPAIYTPVILWQNLTEDLWSPTPFAWASAVIAVATLGLTVAQYRTESRRRELYELADILAETLKRSDRG